MSNAKQMSSDETTNMGMHLSKDWADRIRRQADREHRSISSLLKSIVLPEIERREPTEDEIEEPGEPTT